MLDKQSSILANKGGVEVSGNAELANQFALELLSSMTKAQLEVIDQFIHQKNSFLVFDGLVEMGVEKDIPVILPTLDVLEKDISILKLSSRSQIILALTNQVAFAYDIDNYGKITRLVATFKGGGVNKLENEKIENVDKSSHSGIALGAHTEAPYHTAINIKDNHSPSPSSLILTALWNPLFEPTSVIPIAPILEKMHFTEVLALTTPNFDFTRSETFTDGKGTGGSKVSILELNEHGDFAMKYNSYRFTVNKDAPEVVKQAFYKFEKLVIEAEVLKVNLNSRKVLIINNTKALHCRDIIQDNRRLLVRLFGYWKGIKYIEINKDPLLVQG